MKSILQLLLFLFLSFSAQAQTTQQNYPELMVVPKASERLIIEAQRAEKNAWTDFLPLHIASAATLAAGITTLSDLDKDKDEEGIRPKIAIAVGAGWLATSIWLQTNYRPYKKAAIEVRKMPNQSTREQLAAERMAEEHIDRTANLAKKIKWLSFMTNAGASAFTIDSAKKDSAAQGIATLATATSLLPLLFPLVWEQVSVDQHSYKKKVFGPVTFTNGLLLNPVNQRPTMGLIVGTYFN